jgi:putative cell wall-binding protein
MHWQVQETTGARTRTGSGGLAVLAALALALAAALALPLAPVSAQEEQEVAADRIAGPERYSTAAEVALATSESSEAAIIASGENWPDALVASYGPLGTDSPILLSGRDAVPQVTLDALEALAVDAVYIMGGEGALHGDVEAQLRDAGHVELFRVGGANRYETAALTLDGPQQPVIGTLDGERTALLASGEDFADALSVGPVAASADLPLLLTPTAEPHPATDAVLEAQGIERIVVVGGDAAVSADVVEHYEAEGYTVERWAGTTRTATAATVADNAVERLGFREGTLLLARGDDYPDALTASVHGGTLNAPLLLTATRDTLSDDTAAWLEAACPAVETVRAIGGSAAVSDAVLGQAVDAAAACVSDPALPTSIDVTAEQITDQDGNVLLTIDELPDNVQPDPDTEVGGPTQLNDAVLSGDRAWIAIGSAGVAHGYGWLHDIAADETHFVAFQFEGSVEALNWSPDDRFALFSIGSPAEIGLLKVVDRDDIQPYAETTGFVVEVDEEAELEPPYAYELVEWRAPHTLCFEFEGTPGCVDAATGEPQPVG